MKKYGKKWILLTVGTTLILAVFFLSQESSVYHKVTRFEYIIQTFSYSLDKGLALVLPREEEEFLLSMPYYKQEHPVTCEVAALRTALSYHGAYVSEDELLGNLNFDTREPMTPDGVWGDPDKGFVGSVSGSIFHRTGFGVYEKPILDLALKYRPARIIEGADLTEVLDEVVSGNPVLVWGLLSQRAPVSWQSKEGKFIEVRPGEHVRVVIGFVGEKDSPKEIILLDPIYGLIRQSSEKFLSDWKIMDNRTLVVYK